MMEIIIISIGDIIVNETIEISIICIGGIRNVNESIEITIICISDIHNIETIGINANIDIIKLDCS